MVHVMEHRSHSWCLVYYKHHFISLGQRYIACSHGWVSAGSQDLLVSRHVIQVVKLTVKLLQRRWCTIGNKAAQASHTQACP